MLQEHGVDASAAGQLFPDRFEVRVEIEASGRPSAGCAGGARRPDGVAQRGRFTGDRAVRGAAGTGRQLVHETGENR